MNTEKTIRRLGMFATALLTTSALATTVMAAPVVTCPDTGATQVQTDLTVAGTTTAINGAWRELSPASTGRSGDHDVRCSERDDREPVERGRVEPAHWITNSSVPAPMLWPGSGDR